MARIAGIDIPKDKQAKIALTYIYGVGATTSRSILEKAQVGEEVRMKDLTEEEVTRIRSVIDKEYEVEGDLRRSVTMNKVMGIALAQALRLLWLNAWAEFGNRLRKTQPNNVFNGADFKLTPFSVCRCCLGGSMASILVMAGRKPISSSWSASSKTRQRMLRISLSAGESSSA